MVSSLIRLMDSPIIMIYKHAHFLIAYPSSAIAAILTFIHRILLLSRYVPSGRSAGVPIHRHSNFGRLARGLCSLSHRQWQDVSGCNFFVPVKHFQPVH